MVPLQAIRQYLNSPYTNNGFEDTNLMELKFYPFLIQHETFCISQWLKRAVRTSCLLWPKQPCLA